MSLSENKNKPPFKSKIEKLLNNKPNTPPNISPIAVIKHNNIFESTEKPNYSFDEWWNKTHWFLKFTLFISLFLFIFVLSFEVAERSFHTLLFFFILVILILVFYSIHCLVDDCQDLTWTWLSVAILFCVCIITFIILSQNKKFTSLIKKSETLNKG
jgi:hypothetical protein